MGAIAFAAGFALAGCGAEPSRSVTANVEAPVPAATPAAPASATPPSAAEPVAQVSAGPLEAAEERGVAPDISIAAIDSLVRPGEVIEFVVDATPDVVTLELWDGIHDRQAFAYDMEAKAWRVSYRVPLRMPWDRTGLSITARNASQRWTRKWVFIRYATDAPAPGGGTPDSTSSS
jgi:hypothetical protein